MAPVEVRTFKAFSSSSASGNPAAVIVLPKREPTSDQPVSHMDKDGFLYTLSPPASVLQAVAKQINLPMTAFLIPLNKSTENASSADYALRWFNPSSEAPLCGHATLAASHHLFSTLSNPPQTLRFQTRLFGLVSASLYQSPFEDEKLVGIQFPQLINLPLIPKGAERWNELRKIFEGATSSTWEDIGEPVGLYEGSSEILLEYSPELDLKALQVDVFNLVKNGVSPKVVYLFQVSAQKPEHLHTRVFNTGAHCHEDIATGSAHRAIIPHALSNAATHARIEKYHPGFEGNTLRVAQQSSEGGELTVEWLQDAKSVLIMGKVSLVDVMTIDIS